MGKVMQSPNSLQFRILPTAVYHGTPCSSFVVKMLANMVLVC